jgi:hypothetical protein
MSRRVRATLSGLDAELGLVAATDFARLLIGTQSAVAKAAGHIISRPVRATGRWAAVIEDAARLRLVAVEPGSVQSVLQIPDVEVPEGAFDFDVATLGDMAFDRVLDLIDGVNAQPMLDVAGVLMNLADQIGIGSRFQEIRLEIENSEGTVVRSASLDQGSRERIRTRAGRPPSPQPDHVVGVLFAANFETRRAQLRLSGGELVSVEFADDLADAIQDALRQQSDLVGEVKIDPHARVATSVVLRKITKTEQLLVGANEFWTEFTIADLIEEQGVRAAEDWEDYRGPVMSDDDVNGLLSFLDS